MIIPPIRTNGVARTQTIAILHSNKAEITMPASKERKPSKTVAVVSVVSPLRLVISSDKMLLKIPGALSCLSYQDTCLNNRDENRLFLIVSVRFSPASENITF